MTMSRYLAPLALAAFAVPGAAGASVTITGITGNPGFETGRIVYTPGGIGGNAATTQANLNIGRIQMTGVDNSTMQAVTFESYCIDIFNYVKNGTFDIVAFSLPDATKAAQLKTLLGNTAGAIAAAGTAAQKKDVSAAIQMAVWEIVNEAGTTGYSLDNGQFKVASNYGTVVPNARGIAQGYLASLGSWSQAPGFSYRMMTAINPTSNQRQVFLAAVPEPSAWALLILGFGVIGGAMRSRRTARFAQA